MAKILCLHIFSVRPLQLKNKGAILFCNTDTHILYHRFMANAVGKQLECETNNIAPPTSPP